MCGITGKVFVNGQTLAKEDIWKMNDAIKHRGPDDSGVYVSPKKNIGLGHQRLSIIDLSSLGHQPMGYLNRYWIVFNGEIYNFQEQKKRLEGEGYSFRSETDTEVIMALYDKYKEKCLEYLRGMFAFAIYDEKEEVLFCARDRVGKKPFKYYWDGKLFMFSSELKAILTQPEYHREPDYLAIHHYLTYQYCPAPYTGFIGINKLEPAHYINLHVPSGKLEKRRYWRLNYSKKINLTEGEWIERIMEKLEESVKIRMIADVPLGAFLSGGVDSSAVVALMSKYSKMPVKTFSVGFRESKYNELPYARMIADKFCTDHREFIVEPKAIELLPMLVKQYEEPYADSSALPTYYVSKLTRDFVTVALNGDGGDENFAGYERYAILQFSEVYKRFFSFHKQIIQPLSNLSATLFQKNFFELTKRFSETLSLSPGQRYVGYTCYFTNDMKDSLYTEIFKQKMCGSDSVSILAEHFVDAGTKKVAEQAIYSDFSVYLPDDLLVKVDIATMTTALEGRSPFLDHEMLELTAQIPFEYKLKGVNNKKYILKKALENILPREVLYRKKMGFGIPIHGWFRGELKNYARELLLSDHSNNRGIFKRSALEKMLKEHEEGKTDHGNRIWALVTLELWFQEYFDHH